ncbi:phosphatidylinositol polyphosphate 5-phosphatase type IV-like isoform X1 [Mytilus edulis]|uniref:phosphatidylinositol polyphosphate 5-phosphatase type IV-like isoform X1 n=2 Tax=Mytilus edulis TaxID=6550 RepID=UPI0039EF0557
MDVLPKFHTQLLYSHTDNHCCNSFSVNTNDVCDKCYQKLIWQKECTMESHDVIEKEKTETKPPASKSKKIKKKSAIAKLTEKRRISESGSEFGSAASLRSNTSKILPDKNLQAENINLDKKGDKLKLEADKKDIEISNLKKGDKPSKLKVEIKDNLLQNLNTDTTKETVKDKLDSSTLLITPKGDNQTSLNTNASSVKSDSLNKTPIPKPRNYKVSSDASDISPPNYMDIDTDSDEKDKKVDDEDIISNKAPSDATVRRFRALKVANQRSGSLESLKNSPFVPKPPETPKSGRSHSKFLSKGEKRNRETHSSGEEANSSKSKKQEDMTETMSTDDVFVEDTKTGSTSDLKYQNDVQMSPGRDSKMGSEVDIAQITENYKHVLQNDNDSITFGKLPPVSPKTHPPPLPGDISSRSLRTMYKADASFKRIDKTSFDTVSNRSSTSSAIIAPISIKEARARSGTGGNASVSSVLLSSEELERYFPDKRLKIWVGCWNMGELKECSTSLQDFVLPEASEYVQDMYVIGTQENSMHKKEWEIQIQATLGMSHVLFHSATHGALHLAIFIRRDLIWFCSVPDEDQVTTRAVTMVKTKGAVAIAFSFFGTSFVFLNCHFTSDDGKLKDRVSDFQRINSTLKLPKNPTQQGDISANFDSVFWLGDLNFRIDKGRRTVEDIVKAIIEQDHPNFEDLLHTDELLNCLLQEKVFQGYQEGRINFKPTYKFDLETDNYDTSAKLRIPSYTDRVLFHSKKKNGISCTHYDAVMNVKKSDHRPVYGLYDVILKAGRDGIQMSAGQFDREVYVEAAKRRSFIPEETTKKDQKSSGVCSVQ